MSLSWEMEDYLESQNVFTNSLTDKPCHMNSYMTVLSFDKLETIIKSNKFTKENWLYLADQYKNSDLPMEKLVRLVILKIFKIKE